jgi:hypothetical protein
MFDAKETFAPINLTDSVVLMQQNCERTETILDVEAGINDYRKYQF